MHVHPDTDIRQPWRTNSLLFLSGLFLAGLLMLTAGVQTPKEQVRLPFLGQELDAIRRAERELINTAFQPLSCQELLPELQLKSLLPQ